VNPGKYGFAKKTEFDFISGQTSQRNSKSNSYMNITCKEKEPELIGRKEILLNERDRR